MTAPPRGRRRHVGTATTVALVAVLLGLRLWAAELRGGTTELVVVAVAVVAIAGPLFLLIWWRWRASGEHQAAAARQLGFMAGSVWYTAAAPVEQPGQRGLLVVRRTGLAWLPRNLDPSLVRELPLQGSTVTLAPGGKQVLAHGLGTFRVDSAKGLPAALEAVGVPFV